MKRIRIKKEPIKKENFFPIYEDRPKRLSTPDHDTTENGTKKKRHLVKEPHIVEQVEQPLGGPKDLRGVQGGKFSCSGITKK